MTIPPLIVTLVLGGIAGWLASLLVGGSGGIIRNVIIGLVGAVVGHFVLGAVGLRFGGPFLHSMIAAVLGGVIVIIASRFLSR
ncbi:MAG: GlsB/YeaQ/YmgE family stress response membrane protein [Beijerinckiaceae bacterium]|nr:GlsB/YeaQ/YmgE family stress response membrane protein [Beijerinckiaceae bacterium]MCZ8299755.1 GlsB/YeaQ/YmgE family stress response membrane protein [Beijerinckiaceae bacterium]